MTDDDYKRSTANLKKAVPLMMKHHVAATPANYALWYTYVDNAIPQLTRDLDEVLDLYGVCPPAAGAQLYSNYVAKRADTNIKDLRSNIELLVGEVASTMADTLVDTSQFSEMIDKSFKDIEKVEDENMSLEAVMKVVRQLVDESKEIRHSTKFLNNQLENASEEIQRLKQQLADVQKDALFDNLTSLYNRQSFDADLRTLCNAGSSLSLVLTDVDNFKSFNDNYGHLFGDSVIKGIARRLQLSSRDGIHAYRFGGEEFALIVPNKPLQVACHFAENLRRSIEKLAIKDRRTGKQVANITASFGVAELHPGEGPEALIERADDMLYEAKNLGRNKVMPA